MRTISKFDEGIRQNIHKWVSRSVWRHPSAKSNIIFYYKKNTNFIGIRYKSMLMTCCSIKEKLFSLKKKLKNN